MVGPLARRMLRHCSLRERKEVPNPELLGQGTFLTPHQAISSVGPTFLWFFFPVGTFHSHSFNPVSAGAILGDFLWLVNGNASQVFTSRDKPGPGSWLIVIVVQEFEPQNPCIKCKERVQRHTDIYTHTLAHKP